jgi:hypothetical protein
LVAIDLLLDPTIDLMRIFAQPPVIGLLVLLASLQVAIFGELFKDFRDVGRG